MHKQNEGTPYIGGTILGTIPQNLLESGSLRVDSDGETVRSFSDEASQFLEQNRFHKKNNWLWSIRLRAKPKMKVLE